MDKHSREDKEFYTNFSSELKAVEKKIAGEIEPGLQLVFLSCGVLLGIISLLLPHAGHTRGVDILTGMNVNIHDAIGLPSRLFTWFFFVFAIVMSTITLLTKKWLFALISAAGCAITMVLGILSMWLRQTPGVISQHPPHAGIGLLLEFLLTIFFLFNWVKIVGTRSKYHIVLEQERRDAARKQQESKNS